MATDTEILKTKEEGIANTLGMSSPKNGVARRFMRRHCVLMDATEGTANANTVEGFMFTNADGNIGGAIRVHKVQIIPLAALTSNATDYANYQLTYDNGNGGSDTVITSKTTQPTANGGTGNWTALTVIDISPSAPVDVPASSLLHRSLLKTANGVNVVRHYLQIDFEDM